MEFHLFPRPDRSELADHFGRLAAQGVDRVYAWFCDFAPPDTLAAFGAEVIGREDQSQSSRTDAYLRPTPP